MKAMLGSIIVCFSMYSRIPMPHLEWEEENMQYAFCFFPLLGVLVGSLVAVATYFLSASGRMSDVFVGAIATGILLIFTGGIHMDGFLDTCDGIFSYGNREKKLKILADPQAGAFGVIYSVLYLLGMVAVFAQVAYQGLLWPVMMVLPFVLSRIIGGWMVVGWSSAKESGLKHIFAQSSRKKTVKTVLLLWFLVTVAIGLWQQWLLTMIILGASGLLLLFLHRYFKRQFGGLTGDLIGFTISVMELLSLFLLAVFSLVIV